MEVFARLALVFINKKLKNGLEELGHLSMCKMNQIAGSMSVFTHLTTLKSVHFFLHFCNG
ncbi:MAG: hypothetical protein ACJA2M_001141 [Polaribacter sp.]|jgi:hypothetical protein